MKTNNFLKLFAASALSLVSVSSFAQVVGASGTSAQQDITLEVKGTAKLAIVNTDPAGALDGHIVMSLTGSSATEAGAEIKDVITNNLTRLRISSMVNDGKTRTISAKIDDDLSDAGTELHVKLERQSNFKPLAANGGDPQNEILLAELDQDIVKNIKTCWSGTETNDGYIVTYRFVKQADAEFVVNRNVKVTYTISDEK